MMSDSVKAARSGLAVAIEQAMRERRRADVLEQDDARDPADAFSRRLEAGRARGEAARLLTPPAPLVGSEETELVPAITAPDLAPADGSAHLVPLSRVDYVNTLADPDAVAIDASEHRTSLLQRAGVLSLGLDAARSTRASHSLEKMLAHQLAALHKATMDLLIRLESSGTALPPVEAARLTNAAAHCSEAFQSGCLVQQKLKTGGQQRVLVQYQQVNVGPGGQAIVAGKIGRGSRRRRQQRPVR
jgi:hypothetical protein